MDLFLNVGHSGAVLRWGREGHVSPDAPRFSGGSRIFTKGMRNRGSVGRKSLAGSKGGAPVGVAEPPEARDIMLNSRLKTSEHFNIKK